MVPIFNIYNEVYFIGLKILTYLDNSVFINKMNSSKEIFKKVYDP